jgi:3-methyl-2-oxobutanoate hydroxymethyltransferase
MSLEKKNKKITVPVIVSYKETGEKISALTAYDYLMAKILDEVGIDIILVGDSVGMVVAGEQNTLAVSMDEMLYHVRIVSRAVKRALVVADMPFLSYQVSVEQGVQNAGRFLKESAAEAVKIEGAEPVLNLIYKLTSIGIPVMGHIGLVPQSIHQFGGYELQGKNPKIAEQLKKDARLLEEAGAFSIVLEKIPRNLAADITQTVRIPTIGIGAGVDCDGQILVSHDILGLFEKFKPRFVRRYAELGAQIRKAFDQYTSDVKNGVFPSNKESFD